ncbi:MAG: TonB family protein [Acidobacteriota bacterium]
MSARRFLRRYWALAVGVGAVVAALIGVLVLLHPRGASAGAGSRQSEPAAVTADRADLKRDASRESAVLASLARGSRVRVIADRGGWVEVESEAGARGFLPAESVERDADRDTRLHRAQRLLAFAPVYGVVAEDTDISLAPDPLAPRGGRLKRGTVVAIHSVDHSFFAFRDEQWGLAFVNSAQVDLVPRDPRQPAISAEKTRPLTNVTIVNLGGEPPPEEEPMADSEAAAGEPEPPVARKEALPGLIEPPAILKRVQPAYPDLARRAGLEGTVELEVSIDASGKVTDVEVVRGLPLELSNAAADAVRRWTYRPARGPNGPIASRKTVRIRFTLEPAENR